MTRVATPLAIAASLLVLAQTAASAPAATRGLLGRYRCALDLERGQAWLVEPGHKVPR